MSDDDDHDKIIVLDDGLLHVEWSVCISVYQDHDPYKNCLNHSRCHFQADLHVPKELLLGGLRIANTSE